MVMNNEYASKGVAGAGLGTGIAGLSLGVLNSLGGLAGLGGLFGARTPTAAQNDLLTAALTASMLNGRTCGSVPCGSDCDPVTQREMRLVQEIAAKDSQIALRDANTYNDQKALEMYKYIDGRFREVEAQLGAQAVQNQATKDSFQLLQERLECCCDKQAAALECERKERRCADDIIVNYVNQTFYPKDVATLTTGAPMTAQKTYNPLPACSCDCGK